MLGYPLANREPPEQKILPSRRYKFFIGYSSCIGCLTNEYRSHDGSVRRFDHRYIANFDLANPDIANVPLQPLQLVFSMRVQRCQANNRQRSYPAGPPLAA